MSTPKIVITKRADLEEFKKLIPELPPRELKRRTDDEQKKLKELEDNIRVRRLTYLFQLYKYVRYNVPAKVDALHKKHLETKIRTPDNFCEAVKSQETCDICHNPFVPEFEADPISLDFSPNTDEAAQFRMPVVVWDMPGKMYCHLCAAGRAYERFDCFAFSSSSS